jgi:hypothetical protein
VKLFVKRGNKPFSSGMVGHLKLLSDKSTSTERLCEWFISLAFPFARSLTCPTRFSVPSGSFVAGVDEREGECDGSLLIRC